MSSNLFRPYLGRMAAALMVFAATQIAVAQDAPSPRYTYLGAGYEWVDVKYAVRSPGAKHDGLKVEGSLGILDWLHVYGEYFDGDFDFNNSDSTGFHAGAGFNFGFTDSWDIVARAAIVDVEIEGTNPNGSSFTLDDDGYQLEGLLRGMVSDRTEINVGYSYTDIDESGNANRDVTVGINYDVTSYATIKARSVVFGNDTGIEFGLRFYLGDSIF